MGRVGRGDLWLVAGGVYASKPRPALVIQANVFAETDSLTVIPLTSQAINSDFFRILIAANVQSGLKVNSFVMVDKLTTVRRINVVEHVGVVSAAQLLEVERAMLAFLGMAE